MMLTVALAALAFTPIAPLGRRSAVSAPCVQMAAIAAKDVKALRDKTGAGMMDCKSALAEAGGDMEKAADALRAKGLAAAGKRADKATSEGVIETYIHTGGKLGVMVEVRERLRHVCTSAAARTSARVHVPTAADNRGASMPRARARADQLRD